MDESVTPWIADAESGVYFGYASLLLPAPGQEGPPATEEEEEKPGFKIFPMVMSIGYNPFYKNTVRSAEVHVLHKFASDFYGTHMRLLILGFVRKELDYTTLEALVEDINTDCDVARASLAREAWAPARGEADEVDVDGTLDATWLLRPLDG